MKILIASRGVIPLKAGCGGAEIVVYQLARSMALRGHAVTLVGDVDERDFQLPAGLEVVRVQNRARAARFLPDGLPRWIAQHLLGNVLAARRTRKLLRERPGFYDVVHAHGALSALLSRLPPVMSRWSTRSTTRRRGAAATASGMSGGSARRLSRSKRRRLQTCRPGNHRFPRPGARDRPLLEFDRSGWCHLERHGYRFLPSSTARARASGRSWVWTATPCSWGASYPGNARTCCWRRSPRRMGSRACSSAMARCARSSNAGHRSSGSLTGWRYWAASFRASWAHLPGSRRARAA